MLGYIVRRLLLLATPSPVAYVQQYLTANEKLVLAQSPYQNTTALFGDCLLACVDAVLWRMKPDGMLFLRAEFDAVRERIEYLRDHLPDAHPVLLPRSQYGHFGPLEQPDLVAREIGARLDLLAGVEGVGR